MNLLGYNLHILNLNKINFKSKTIINTINPHTYAVAKYDNEFKSSLTNSNYLMPDGVGFVLKQPYSKTENYKKELPDTIYTNIF